MKKTILLIFLITLPLLLLPQKAHGATFAVGIYPPIIQITSKPPANITTQITLNNDSDESVELVPSFKPFTQADSKDGTVAFLSDKNPLGPDSLLFQRIELFSKGNKVTSIVLAPKQQQKIDMKITLPAEEPLSDYYFSVVFVAKANAVSSTSNTQIPGGVATNVLLSIGPKGTAEASISQFSAPSFLQHGPVPFTVLVNNTGEHAIAPQGEIIITNLFGQTVGIIPLLPVNILKQSERYIPDTQIQPASFNGKPVAVWSPTVLLGPYTAHLRLALTNQGPLLQAQTKFLILPIQVIVGAFIVVLLLLIVAERVQKRLREK